MIGEAAMLAMRGVLLVVGCMLFAAGVLLLVSDHRENKAMSKKRSIKRRQARSYHQCDSCEKQDVRCSARQMAETAEQEISALKEGRHYECPDLELPWLDRLNAA